MIAVDREDHFATIRTQFHQFAVQLEENAAIVPDTLASPEVAGQLGLSQRFISKTDREEVGSHTEAFAATLKDITEQAENYSDLIASLLELSSEYGFDEQLIPEDKEDNDYVHIGQLLFGMCCEFLDDLDELTGTTNHNVLCDLVEDLHQQDMLSNASSLCCLYFMSDQNFLFSYGNTFYREIPNLIDDLNQVTQREEPQYDKLISLYRSWGSLCETAISPVIAVIHYLENQEIDVNKADGMKLKNSVDWIQNFPPLEPIGSRLNVDLRNGVLHGGKNGGCTPNPVTDEVTIWYKQGQETKTEVYSIERFREIVIKTLTAVITLFLIPAYLIFGHACIEITEAVA